MLFRQKSRISSYLLALGLVAVMLPMIGLAEPHVWPAWRAMTAQGKEFSSRQLDGKVVVMTMWASWCPSCRKQLPVLDALQEQYREDSVQVLSFSFDHSEKTHEEFVAKHGLRFPSIFARKGEGLKVVRMLQKGTGSLEAVPTVLIYDKRGRLTHHLVGFFSRKQLEDLISPLLDE